jgi:hypothetical protein
MIAFVPSNGSGLQQVSDGGGTPRPLTRLEIGEVSPLWPEFLPGGRAVLFAAGTNGFNFTNAQVAAQSVRTGERRNLIQGGTYPPPAPGLFARGEPDGRAVRSPEARGHRHGGSCGRGCPAIPSQRSGPVQLFRHGIAGLCSGGVQSNQSKLVWVSRDGAEQPLTAPARAYRGPRLSPDGRRVAVGITEQESHYRILERLEGGGMGVVYKAEGTKLHRFVGSTGSLSRSNSCWSWGRKLQMRWTQHTRRGLFTATSIAGGQSLEASTAVCQLPEKIIRPVLG